MLIDIANGKTVAIPPVLEKLYKINPGNHETIEEFASKVKQIEKLDYLYLLTINDIPKKIVNSSFNNFTNC